MKIKIKVKKVHQDDMTKTAWLEKVIQKNKPTFKAGTAFDHEDLCEMLDITPNKCPVKHNMEKFAAYASLNKILKLRGLAIRSHNYYSTFEVLSKTRARSKTAKLQSTSLSKRRHATELKSAIAKFDCKWTALTTAERKQAAKSFNRQY